MSFAKITKKQSAKLIAVLPRVENLQKVIVVSLVYPIQIPLTLKLGIFPVSLASMY